MLSIQCPRRFGDDPETWHTCSLRPCQAVGECCFFPTDFCFLFFWGYLGLRLIIMRIRFRASDFGLLAKDKDHPCKVETGFLCGDGARVIRFFARVIQQLGLWTQKFQANVDYCYVRAVPRAFRSALDSSIQAYAQTLVWPRRDVPRRFTWHFFSTKYPSPAR